VAVPTLAGLEQAAASAALGALGLRPGRIHRRASSSAAGTVVEQDPAAGTLLASGLRVDLVLAAAARVAVPPLAGFGVAGATEALTARGLVLGTVRSRIGEGTPGTIDTQRPAAGELVAAGSAIDVVLVAGMPSVLSLPVADAKRMLEAVGLHVDEETRESPPPLGVVVAQDPAPGDPLPEDDRARLTVTVAPQVAVPRVLGRQPSDALAVLQLARLVGRTAGTEPGPNDDVAEGTVRRQEPKAGQRVAEGTAVSLWLRAASQVAVPDVLRLPLADAVAKITDARLQPRVGAEVATIAFPVGSVAAQEPAAGARVNPGSTVVLQKASPAPVEVPDVRGYAPQAAADLLATVGLTSHEDDRYGFILLRASTSSIVAGTSPEPFSTVPVGTDVTLVVGLGLPDMQGMRRDAAVQLGRNLSLEVTVNEVVGRGQQDTVVGTDPQAGSPVVPGDGLVLAVVSRWIVFDPGRFGVAEVEIAHEIPHRVPQPEPDPEPFVVLPFLETDR
jgi:beta-lactam-binding protein with PASTA domain